MHGKKYDNCQIYRYLFLTVICIKVSEVVRQRDVLRMAKKGNKRHTHS